MNIEQASRHIGDWVRYRLHGPVPHLARGRIVGIREGKVMVQPPRHKQVELMDAKELRLWKSRNLCRPSRATGH